MRKRYAGWARREARRQWRLEQRRPEHIDRRPKQAARPDAQRRTVPGSANCHSEFGRKLEALARQIGERVPPAVLEPAP